MSRPRPIGVLMVERTCGGPVRQRLDALLQRHGLDYELDCCVDRSGLERLLAERTFDVVVAEWTIPDFPGAQILEVLREQAGDVPTIVLSEALDEALAVRAMRAGAADFVTLDRLQRLVPALRREVERHRSRQVVASARARAEGLLDSFSHLVHAMPLGVTVLNVAGDGRFVVEDANPAARRLGLFVGGDRAGSDWQDRLPAVVESACRRALRTRVSERLEGVEVTGITEEAVLDITVVPFGLDLLGVLTEDATEKARLEAQMRAAQRMEAVGRLAGGIAHDFNNILSVIHSFSEFLAESLDEDDPRADDLDAIRDAASRATGLTRQLLAISRHQVGQLASFPLNDVVRDLEPMLRRMVGEDVRIRTELTEPGWFVEMDPTHLEQILLNLAVNARDAMPQGGDLVLRTSHKRGALPELEGHGSESGDVVVLTASDTGEGMDEATRLRVFDPFFTTKDPSKGTGLGLSTVYGIVKQLGGAVWVESEPGRGATFRVELPRHHAEERSGQYAPVRSDGDLHGLETVLLVEDEQFVRRAARRVLARAGYHVLEAECGTAALEVAAAFPERIDALLTDIVMPDLSGPELAQRLREARPELRVVYMSGYPQGATDAPGGLPEGFLYVQKPFTPKVLLTRLRQALQLDRP